MKTSRGSIRWKRIDPKGPIFGSDPVTVTFRDAYGGTRTTQVRFRIDGRDRARGNGYRVDKATMVGWEAIDHGPPGPSTLVDARLLANRWLAAAREQQTLNPRGVARDVFKKLGSAYGKARGAYGKAKTRAASVHAKTKAAYGKAKAHAYTASVKARAAYRVGKKGVGVAKEHAARTGRKLSAARGAWAATRDPSAGYPAGITRANLEQQTKPLLEETFRADPHLTEEIVRRVFGRSTFVWPRATVLQLRALRRAIYPLVLEARG
jgi:hypothetical protein